MDAGWCPRRVGVLLAAAARTAGLDRALSTALEPWRSPMARHDPGKIVLDLAVALALGGDCLADIAQLRSQPGVFGPVASDPTVSRLIDGSPLMRRKRWRPSHPPGAAPGAGVGAGR